jgi:hypothetical protein
LFRARDYWQWEAGDLVDVDRFGQSVVALAIFFSYSLQLSSCLTVGIHRGYQSTLVWSETIQEQILTAWISVMLLVRVIATEPGKHEDGRLVGKRMKQATQVLSSPDTVN